MPRTTARAGVPLALTGLLLVAGALTAVASAASSVRTNIGPEGVVVYHVPDLAPASTTATGAPVDGLTCRRLDKEVVHYHVHVEVEIFVNGARERLPAGIGITKPYLVEHMKSGPFLDVGVYDCLYWLHTHVPDGIVHVEAPAKGSFTLGQLFDVWRQPLSPTRAGSARGPVVIFQNGRRLTGDPRATPLTPHSVIQIDVGTPVVAFHPFTFKVTGGCGAGSNGCSAG